MQSNQFKIPTLVARVIQAWESHLPGDQKHDMLARIAFLLNDESVPYTAKLRTKRKQIIVVLMGLYRDLYRQPGWEDLLFSGERPVNDEPDVGQEVERTRFDVFTADAERGISACFEVTRDVDVPLPARTDTTVLNGRRIITPDEFEQRVGMLNQELDEPGYQRRFAEELSSIHDFIAGEMNKGRRHAYWDRELPCAEALEVLKRQYERAGWSVLIIAQPKPTRGGSLSWRRSR